MPGESRTPTRYRATRPYSTPRSLADLVGPSEGLIELPVRLFWAPKRTFDVSSDSGAARAYEAVIAEGTPQDQREFLNRSRLLDVWPDLRLDRRVVEIWEREFSELQGGGAW